MIYKTCCWGTEITGDRANGMFVVGSKNYKLSAVKDHHASEPYDAVKKAKNDAGHKK